MDGEPLGQAVPGRVPREQPDHPGLGLERLAPDAAPSEPERIEAEVGPRVDEAGRHRLRPRGAVIEEGKEPPEIGVVLAEERRRPARHVVPEHLEAESVLQADLDRLGPGRVEAVERAEEERFPPFGGPEPGRRAKTGGQRGKSGQRVGHRERRVVRRDITPNGQKTQSGGFAPRRPRSGRPDGPRRRAGRGPAPDAGRGSRGPRKGRPFRERRA